MTLAIVDGGTVPKLTVHEMRNLIGHYLELKQSIKNIKSKDGFYIDGDITCSNLVFFHDDKLHTTFQKILGQKVMRVLHDHLQEIEKELTKQGIEI